MRRPQTMFGPLRRVLIVQLDPAVGMPTQVEVNGRIYLPPPMAELVAPRSADMADQVAAELAQDARG